jgi:signal transduction histidine kinase
MMALTGIGAVFMLGLLRYTKNPKAMAWLFSVYTIVGICSMTYFDHAGQTESFVIGAAYTPYMIAALVFICLVGTYRSALFFSALCLMTLVAFHNIGMAMHHTPALIEQSRLGLVLRTTSVFLTASIMIPVTEMIHQTLKELEETIARAKRAEQARKTLIATMSHEIRTPLNGIISVSELLEKRDNDQTMRTHLNIISLSANNLLEIVNETLGKARSDHIGEPGVQDIELRSEEFDPARLLEQCTELFTPHAKEKSLWIGTYGLEELPTALVGSAAHIRQVVCNLLGNAIKFTQNGGIRVGARVLGTTGYGHALQIFVQDTGAGIEEEALSAIFERFGQSASARTTSGTGTGLGLSISRDLVEAMGGTLEVESRVGHGSTFFFTLDMPPPETGSGTDDRIAA